jgi:hypothetical protein
MQATPIINYKEAYEALVLKYDDVMQELAMLKKMVFGSFILFTFHKAK